VNRASEVLLNKKKRELYDELGEHGLRGGLHADAYRAWSGRGGRGGAPGAGGAAGFAGIEDLFGRMRRGGGRSPGAGSGAGGFADIFSSDMFTGTGQRGRAPASPSGASADITIEWMESVLGTEKELSIHEVGAESAGRALRVRIPAGVRDGGQVRLRGQAPDGGDIVLRVHVKPHDLFRRTDDDLELTLPITVGEAFHGAKVQVPTPYGAVTLRVPKGVKGGSRLRLKGKGVRRGQKAGDLYVDLQIVLPQSSEAGEAIGRATQAIAPGDHVHLHNLESLRGRGDLR